MALLATLVVGTVVAPAPDARAAGETASVTGTVVLPEGMAFPTGDNRLRVVEAGNYSGSVRWDSSATVAADGTFTLSGLAVGEEHRILFAGPPSTSLLNTYYDGAYTWETTVPIVLEVGEVRDLGTIQLHRPGSISGSMTGLDGEIVAGVVQSISRPLGYGQLLGSPRTPSFSRALQNYSYLGLPPGEYVLRFSENIDGISWRPIYSGGASSLEQAVPITVGLSENVTVDVVLQPTPRIIGHFSVNRDPSMDAPIRADLTARPFPGTTAGTVRYGKVLAEGEFRLNGLAPGAYQVCAYAENTGSAMPFLTHCYGQDDENPDGTPVIVGDSTVDGIDLEATGGTSISLSGLGFPNASAPGGRQDIGHAFAFFWRFDPELGYWVLESEDSYIGGGGARLESGAMPHGDYRVQLQYAIESTEYREYWPTGATRFSDAEIVSTVPGQVVNLGQVDASPSPLDITRLSGPNRFAGSAAISRELIPTPPVNVVYIANGLNYPDALSAGPAVAAEGGTLLLVQPTLIPAEIETELRRLQPDRIVIVGSTRTVSAAVETRLHSFVDSPSDIERRSGTDRYDTARRVVRGAFGGATGMTVVIATGSNYPDALAAGPVAAALGGPVLLVNGNRPSLDAATIALLDELQPAAFLIAGGTNTVSAGIEAQLLSRTSEVYRAAGRDRYETGRILNSIFVPPYGFDYGELGGTDLVYVATGTGFADALAGGPLAARDGAPLYLTPPRCLGVGIVDAVEDLGAREIVILGGPPAVSTAVEAGVECAVSATRGETTELQRALGELLPAREP